MEELRRGLHRIADEVKAATDSSDEETTNINVAGRKNIHIARNIGGTGGRASASASQSTRIVQRDGETIINETETHQSSE